MAKARKETTEPTPEEVVVMEKPAARWNIGSLFWGSLVILAGVLLLLDNLDVINLDFSEIWQLWPVVLIAIGVSLLPLKGWLAVLVNVVLIGAVLAAVLYVSTGGTDGRLVSNSRETTQTQQVAGGARSAEVAIKIGAGELDVDSTDDGELVEAELTTDSDRLQLNKTSQVTDGRQKVTLEVESDGRPWSHLRRNSLEVSLSEKLPLSLNIDAGAASVSGDLSQLQLEALELSAGASSIELTLGSRVKDQTVTLGTGASSVSLRLPRDAGVKVLSDSGLTSVNFDGLDKISDGRYQSADFDSAERKITINARMGVSSFTISRY